MVRASQLVLGKYEEEHFTPNAICEKIKAANERFKLDRLMIWNSLDKVWFDKIAEFCRDADIEPYLWFPLLSDQLKYQPSKEEAVQSMCDHRGYGKMGIWSMLLENKTLDENFLFLCPNNSVKVDSVFRHFKELVDSYDIEGVFLDRIRYPSPANGIEMISGCYCKHCSRKGERRNEAVKERVRALADQLVEMIQHKDYSFSYQDLIDSLGYADFSKDKQYEIKDLVFKFSEYAHSKGKKVGLDLFSPSLSSLVFQDYCLLSDCCDWIKPMIYCKAWGPAGIPLEISCLLEGLREFINSNSRMEVDMQELWSLTNNVLGMDLSVDYENLKKQGFPVSLVEKEYHKAQTAVSSKDTDIIPGLEFVDHPLFPTRISEEVAMAYLTEIRNLGCGFISCWNILYIPDNYFSIMSRALH